MKTTLREKSSRCRTVALSGDLSLTGFMMKRNTSPALLLPLILIFFPGLAFSAETELEPIVVRQSLPGAARGPVAAVLGKEEIAQRALHTPEEVLSYLGVDVQARGSSGVKSDLSMNASTFQQTLILVNGARVKDPQTAHHDLDLFFTIDDIEKVEIIPASASAKYGPDGIGGAVNFVLKRPRKEKNQIQVSVGNEETFEQKLDLSFNALRSVHRVSLSNAQSNGSRYDTEYRTDTFFYSGALEGERADLYLNTGYNEKVFGAYDFYTPGRGYPSQEWVNTKFADLRGVLKNDSFTFEPRLDFRQHHDKFVLTRENPSLYLNHHTTNTYRAGGILSFPSEKVDFVVGADYEEESIVSNNLGKHTRGHWDFYLDPTYAWAEGSSVNLTVRVDDYTTFPEEFTGSLSLTHEFTEESRVWASAGRTIRVPTFTELYYSDPTTAGDPNLKPEKAWGFEAGGRAGLRQDLDMTGSFFLRQENDTIDFTKRTPADAKFIARNISRAFSYGLNLFIQWKANETTSFDFRYAYASKRQKSEGLVYKYGLNYARHLIDLGMDRQFSFGHNRVDIVFKKKPDRRGWVLVNDKFSVNVLKNLEVFLQVNNLFNVEYQEIEGVPDEGRQVNVGAKWIW